MRICCDIDGYEKYTIDTNGNIYSKKHKKYLKQRFDKDGYMTIGLYANGKTKWHKIHRLLALTFIPNPLNKPQVNHINGIKSDNRLQNLEWVTVRENVKHAYDIGLNKMSQKSKDAVIQRNKQRLSKIVLDTNTGIYYNSVIELSNLRGINYSTLRGWLNGNYKNYSSFKYV